MKKQLYVTFFCLFCMIHCKNDLGNHQLNQSEIVSSKGEKIYISTINLGVTADKQFTVITNKK